MSFFWAFNLLKHSLIERTWIINEACFIIIVVSIFITFHFNKLQFYLNFTYMFHITVLYKTAFKLFNYWNWFILAMSNNIKNRSNEKKNISFETWCEIWNKLTLKALFHQSKYFLERLGIPFERLEVYLRQVFMLKVYSLSL